MEPAPNTPLQRAIARIQALGNADSSLDLSNLGLTSADLHAILTDPELAPTLTRVARLHLGNNHITSITMESYWALNSNNMHYIDWGIQRGIQNINAQEIVYGEEYRDVVSKTNYAQNDTILAIFEEDNELQEFLSKTTPLTNDRIEALNYLFGKLLTVEAENYKAKMKVFLNDCSTPVKTFLTQMLLAKYKENNEEVPKGLVEKIAIGEYLDKNSTKFGITGTEAIEYKQGLLNALFLEGSENNIGNQYLGIVGKPYLRDSDTINHFYPQEEESALKFAKIFCKTDEDGNLKIFKIRNGHYVADQDLEIENGYYLADKEKIDEITDLYRINTGVKELTIPSMKKASEIVKAVVEKYNKLRAFPDGFGTTDKNILSVNKAIKEMAKQDPKIDIENITAGSVVVSFSKAKQHLGDIDEDPEEPENIVIEEPEKIKSLAQPGEHQATTIVPNNIVSLQNACKTKTCTKSLSAILYRIFCCKSTGTLR